MNQNFRVRLWCSIIMLTIVAISLPFWNSLIFRISFIYASIVATIELFSFLKHRKTPINILFTLAETIILILSSYFCLSHSTLTLIFLIIGVCSYDTFAYLFGRIIGGKIFTNSRPFPHISKNKTWEGTFFGLLCSLALTSLLLIFTNSSDFLFLLTAPLALVGDLFESLLKRHAKVKDSNEIIVKNRFFNIIELLVGGTEGHGGYLDRIDSIAFTAAILLFLI